MTTDAETEANLDEFLNLLENDPDYQENNKIENDTESGVKSPQRKALKDLTYEDIFGSPEKKKRKTSEPGENDNNNRETVAAGSSISRNLMSELGSQPIKPSVVKNNNLQGLDINQLVIDPHSRLRLYKTSIELYHGEDCTPEVALQERNLGLQFVNLMAFTFWYRTKGAEQKNFWTAGVLTRKLPGVRKSAKGNEYAIWEMNDLKQLDKTWTIFLFSSAVSSQTLSSIPVGSLIDITTPSVMDSNNGGNIKFSVNNFNQIKLIGTSKDFGFCQSKRKDGKDCTAVVNTWECCTCIHHASSELKKMNGNKGSKKAQSNFVSHENGTNFGKSMPTSGADLKSDGVVTMNFGRPNALSKNSSSSKGSLPSKVTTLMHGKGSTRMELMGSSMCGEVKRNSLSIGNSNSISFKKEQNDFLEKIPAVASSKKQPIDLNPLKTRHLTEKDRMILAALSSPSKDNKDGSKNNKKGEKNKSFNVELASQIVNNPAAGSRNFLKYLTSNEKNVDEKDKNSDPLITTKTEVEPITVTRETIRNMKKALNFVKSNGPIKKLDPNAVSKRKSLPAGFKSTSSGESSSSSSTISKSNLASTSKKRSIEVEFDFKSDEFKKILNAKSAHEEHLADVQQEEYFDKLVKKEAIENKLLSTYSVATNAVMCKQCKYVALSQSDFCKGLQHQIRVVKATKRFFKCKDCGNRTMSLDRLPKHPCKQCSSSSWIAAPLGKEKKGPMLQSEVLAIRGHEEKFIGATGTKMFLNLEVE